MSSGHLWALPRGSLFKGNRFKEYEIVILSRNDNVVHSKKNTIILKI